MSQAQIIEAIYTTSVVGKGIEGDPGRTVHELWTKDGRRICSVDNFSGQGEFHPVFL